MLDGTRDPKQTFLVESGMQERMNLIQMNDLNDVNQMSYKQDLSNNVSDLQSHYKTTAAFVVNNFFYYFNKLDLYIYKTYVFIYSFFSLLISIMQLCNP